MSSKVIAGRYELLNKIGDGGMAVVYKAKDRLLNRFVAVKILKPEFLNDAKFIENFRKESHAAASLTHSNIVSIYDVGREGNINYIVMELVEGKALSQIIKEEAPMDYRRVISISKQIAAGLSAAHKHGIIHRDVKPHNILINEEGVAKIADFGIAKAVSTTTIVDNTNETVMGSVHYFSPEQARGGYVDEKSDIYSLGIVMYEMITGEVPFDGDNPVSVALMHINEEIKPPSQLVPGIPPNLEKIIMKATSKFQTNRYDSADEVIQALNDVELVNRVVAPEYRQKSREEEEYEREVAQYKQDAQNAKQKKKRNKKALIIVLAVIAALAVALAVAFATGLLGARETVPDLRGMSFEKAKTTAEDLGFKVEEGELVYSEKYEIGDVTSQDPDADTKARKGSTITVNVCKGAEEGTVPKLTGLTKSEAKRTIEDLGFKVGDITVKTSTKPENQVIGQDPEAGTITKPGSYIDLVVSDGKGKEKKSVPDLLGKTESEARTALENAGFKAGTVSKGYSTDYASGQVMEQQYSSGTSLEEGTSISFTVSKGSKSSSIKLYVDYESAEQEVFYMTVTVSDDDGTRNVVSNAQRSKSDGGETLKIKGKGSGTITVIFDDETVMKKNVDFSTGEMY
ncbi:MAG: Stk1 family PASTA domain-containing Ser/Thr kinase [Eubacteriaceae bacterium]|nr:Stk1 family PASTA domain-containing Ser/Thr kinase [Eubacteriaceae bacterium]